MSDAREIAQRISDSLAECKEYGGGDVEVTWYGYVRLEDVWALVAAVLGEPLPHDVTEN